MNIFKFSIHVESKEHTNDIRKSVQNSYSEKSKEADKYPKFVQEKWKGINKDNVKALYSEKAIITYTNISKCTYCLIDTNDSDSIDQITFDVIVISEVGDICDTLNTVYYDIQKKLSKQKIKLIDQKALLFIYHEKDIISTEIMIKAEIFSFTKFRMREIIRMAIIVIVAIICFAFSVLSDSSTVDNISYSLIASCLFFLVTEILMKVNFRKEIIIRDFSRWVEKKDAISEDAYIPKEALSNPEY